MINPEDEIYFQDKLRDFISLEFSTGSINAIEAVIFLYLNKEKAYPDREIFENVKENIKTNGITPERTFSTEVRKYTINSPQKLTVSHKKLFTIFDLEESPQRFLLIEDVRNIIDNQFYYQKSKEIFWKCPKSSCNFKETKISRNNDNVINSKTYTDITIHFLQHLSQESPLFGSTDIIKIFLDHTPKGILSVEDKGDYIYDGRTSDKIWKNQIRSALNSLRSKGYISTEDSLDIIEKFNDNIKDRRKLRKRKRTDSFKTDFDLYNDWKILQSNEIIKDNNNDLIQEQNYFIFVFNEQFYENHSFLGRKYLFPTPDKGGYKIIGKSTGSWGPIIESVRKKDKVIWTISGSSARKDKKTFWGHGEIIGINHEDRLWEVKSEEFKEKITIDKIISTFPNEYKDLYMHSDEKINIGFYGTIQIDKFQYNKIIEYCEELQNIQDEFEVVEDEGEREVRDRENHNSIVLKLIQIGKLLNFDVWVALDLKNAVISDIRLGDLTLDDLNIPGVSGDPLNILKRIDVLWLKNKDVVIAGFEVEHTTPIFSGLLRFFDLFISIPSFNIRTFIIAPDRRVNQVINQFNRKTFQKLINETKKKIGVIYYSSLSDGYGIIESIYKSGGNYDIEKFLDNCMKKEWN